MCHLLVPADRRTHIRIVGVVLAAAFALVSALIAVRMGDAANTLVSAGQPTVMKAETVSSLTKRETTGSVR